MNQKSGGRRAVISVCGCLLVQVCVGIIYLWSVLKGSVAERLGMSAGAAAMVSSYETDIRLPSYEVMVRLADLFGVTVDYLLCRQDKRFLDISDLSEEEAALMEQLCAAMGAI